jgi:GT2 family glycosyltransferase
VLIATHNYGRFITEAVESALSQADVAVEVVVVDDGSTDDTHERLATFGDRIRYIYQENGGFATARNTGLRAARGEFIAFLDSDDVWLPFKLKLQLAYLQTHPEVGLVCTDFSAHRDGVVFSPSYIDTYCEVVRWKGRRFETIFPVQERFQFEELEVPAYRGDASDTALEGYFTLTSSVLMRRVCVETCGLLIEDRHFDPAGDVEYFQRISRSYDLAFLDIPTLEYRVHEHQSSGAHNGLRTIRAWLHVAEHLPEWDPDYYAKKRRQVDAVIRFRKSRVAWSAYQAGHYDVAAPAFVRSLAANPWQKRAYLYLALSWIRTLPHRIPLRSGQLMLLPVPGLLQEHLMPLADPQLWGFS